MFLKESFPFSHPLLYLSGWLAPAAAAATARGTTSPLRWFLRPSAVAPSPAHAGGRRRAAPFAAVVVDGWRSGTGRGTAASAAAAAASAAVAAGFASGPPTAV